MIINYYSANNMCQLLLMEESPSVNNAEITCDIDNILKYNQDAFSKKIFKDDFQVFFCLSEAISMDSGDYYLLDMDKFDAEIAVDLGFKVRDRFDSNLDA